MCLPSKPDIRVYSNKQEQTYLAVVHVLHFSQQLHVRTLSVCLLLICLRLVLFQSNNRINIHHSLPCLEGHLV